MASIYSVLNKLKSKSDDKQLIFPTGFIETGNEKYMTFTPVKMNKIYDQVKQKALADSNNSPVSYSHSPAGLTIVLPIPSNLVDMYDYQFGAASLGQIGGILASNLQNASSVTNDIAQSGIAAMVGAAGNLAEAGGQGAAFSHFIGVLNPYLRNNFQAVGFKSHSFNFIMVPRNQQDAIAAKKIVENFKIYSAPFGEVDPILDVKYFFRVTFSEPQNQFLYTIHDCFIQNLQVSYNTMGLSGWHDDGSPVDIQISMTLTELEIASGERLQSDYEAYKDSTKATFLGGGII